jgi:hypothetical protein
MNVDDYASRLGSILDRKVSLIGKMKEKITRFRSQLQLEEEISKKIADYPEFNQNNS